MSTAIRFDAEEAKRHIERTLALVKKERRGLIREMLAIQLKAITDQMESGPHGGGSAPLGVRTGDLRRSFVNPPVDFFGGDGGERLSAVTGSSLEYAPIQDRGGKIEPTSGEFLTVPLPEARTPKGVEKASFAALRRGRKLAWRPVGSGSGQIGGMLGLEKEVANTPANRFRFGLPPLKGRRFVGRVASSDQEKSRVRRRAPRRRKAKIKVFEPLYLLARWVTIRPTHYATLAVEQSERDVLDYAERVVAGWWGGGA